MMRLIAVLSGMMLCASVAHAEPSSLVAFDLHTLGLLQAADPARGEELAESGKCAKCHGDAGISDDPDDVNIAGLRDSYIFKQLKDYQDKNRDDKDMLKTVKDLDDQQLADLAVWFAAQAPAPVAADRNTDPAVLRLVFHGDPTRMLKACASCHGRAALAKGGTASPGLHPDRVPGRRPHQRYLFAHAARCTGPDRGRDRGPGQLLWHCCAGGRGMNVQGYRR